MDTAGIPGIRRTSYKGPGISLCVLATVLSAYFSNQQKNKKRPDIRRSAVVPVRYDVPVPDILYVYRKRTIIWEWELITVIT